jgi:mannose-6-phosphate isomerase
MLYPFTFYPRFKERIWGGRKLEELYQKPLPSGAPIGESWEICDRPGDASVVANGPLAGKDLRWLMQQHAAQLLGSVPHSGRFPWLIKILDARETLSLQVHPPASKAAQLGGEPKTEMWFITDAAPDAELFVGLRRGVTPEQFEQQVRSGGVADCFHRLKVRPGDAMFLPSGRVHAIGGGLVIFEIQQNSDTTYRVFDWNRVGLDGQPRPLHVAESLASIDFKDFEPGLVNGGFRRADWGQIRLLVNDPLFSVEQIETPAGSELPLPRYRLQILGVIRGTVEVHGSHGVLPLAPGRFCLIPASLGQVILKSSAPASFLRVKGGTGEGPCN